jgi:subtilase family serine protease
MEWVANEVRFYIDGQLRVTHTDGATQVAENSTLRMNLWPTNTGFAGSFDPSAVPTESWYDYIRVYDYNG